MSLSQVLLHALQLGVDMSSLAYAQTPHGPRLCLAHVCIISFYPSVSHTVSRMCSLMWLLGKVFN